MQDVVDVEAAFKALTEHWSPRVVAEVNDALVKVAKVQGEFVWHAHDHEDELFHVVRGTLVMQYEDRADVVIGPGQLHVVPSGVRHCPRADDECWILLIEPAATKHTGEDVTPLTKSIDEQRA